MPVQKTETARGWGGWSEGLSHSKDRKGMQAARDEMKYNINEGKIAQYTYIILYNVYTSRK